MDFSLSGSAREEASRQIERHLELQRKLQQTGFLPATAKIDGVYSSVTRAAILAWQKTNGRPETGFISDAAAAVLSMAAPTRPALNATAPTTSAAQSPVARLSPSPTVPPSLPTPSNSSNSTGSSATRADGSSGFVGFIVVVGIIIAISGALNRRAKAQDQKRRIDEVCAYINAVDKARRFPEMPVSINLQHGEFGLLRTSARLSEMRSHRYSTGGSVRIAKGIWVGGRQYHSYRTRDIIDQGEVVITTRRIAYVGGSKTAHVWFRDLVSIEGDTGCNIIHTARRQNAVVIHYREGLLGLILVRFFASTTLPDTHLPDGWHLTARRQGSGISLDLSEAANASIVG